MQGRRGIRLVFACACEGSHFVNLLFLRSSPRKTDIHFHENRFRAFFILIDAMNRFGSRISTFCFTHVFIQNRFKFFGKCSNFLFLPQFLSENRVLFFGNCPERR